MNINERFTITVEPIPNDGRPPIVRLRGLLKTALRAFGLRCVEVAAVKFSQRTGICTQGTNGSFQGDLRKAPFADRS